MRKSFSKAFGFVTGLSCGIACVISACLAIVDFISKEDTSI